MHLIESQHPLRVGYPRLHDPGLINFMPYIMCHQDRGPVFPGPPQPLPELHDAYHGLWFVTPRQHALSDEDVRQLCREAHRLDAPGLILRGAPRGSLRHLAEAPGLRMLCLSHPGDDHPVEDEALAVVRQLRDLEWLDLRATQITDTGLLHLRGLPRLRRLDLDGNAITGAGLVHLADLPALSDLSLGNCPIAEPSLVLLDDLPALRRLDLSMGEHSDVTLAAVGRLSRLEALAIGCKQATGYGLRHLAGLTRLRCLSLGGLREVLGHLRRLRHLPLQTLDLSDAELRQDSLAGLFGHPLHSLCLFGIKLDDESFKHLGGLPELRRFKLFGHACKITSRSMTYLALCSRLEELDLDDLGVGDLGLYRLAGLRHLRRLCLSRTAVSEDSMKVIGALSSLQELDLRVCDLYEESLSFLVALPQLTKLALGAYNSNLPWKPRPRHQPWAGSDEAQEEIHEPAFHWITDRGMRHLGELRGLTHLELPWSYVTDDGLRHLRGLTRLERLRVGGLFTGPGLRHVGELERVWDLDLEHSPICGRHLGPLVGLPRLSCLGLCDTLVDDEGLERHVSRMTRLRLLSLDGTRVTAAGLRHLLALPQLSHLFVRKLRLPSAEMRALQEANPLLHLTPRPEELAESERKARQEEEEAARWARWMQARPE